MKNKASKISIIVSLFVFVGIIVLFSALDLSESWNSWGEQESGDFVYPNWNYILLIIFKLNLYLFPPLIISVGYSIDNIKDLNDKRFRYYFLDVLNKWFLLILILKLTSDSILELDRIFDFNLFSSVADIQTLIGFVMTYFLKENIDLGEKGLLIKNKD